MSQSPAISVVMPVHNTHAYVGAAIESILGQTLADIELIVVDDGSDEPTREVLKGYDGSDARLRIFLRDNHGLSPTRNFAVAQAQASLVANLDSDDVALPHRLETQLQFMNDNPDCLISSGQAMQVDPDGLEIGLLKTRCEHDGIVEQLNWGRGSAIVHTAAIFRKAAFDQVGGYDDRLTTAEDLDLYLKLSEHGRLANIAQVLVEFRRHVTSTTALSTPGFGTENKRKILEAAYRRTGKDPAKVQIREFAYPRSESDLYLSWIETAMAYDCAEAKRKYTRLFMQQNWHNPLQLGRLFMRRTAPFRQRLARAPRGVWKRVTGNV